MTDDFIQLQNKEILRFKIKTSDGEDTGDYIEIDPTDIEMPLIYQEVIEKDKKNKEVLKNQLAMIEKRPDIRGKKVLSKNEEDSTKAIKEFFDKEVEVYNLILGENGVQKLLHGRKVGWSTFKEIDEILAKTILPKLNISREEIKKQIQNDFKEKDRRVLK